VFALNLVSQGQFCHLARLNGCTDSGFLRDRHLEEYFSSTLSGSYAVKEFVEVEWLA
jgi:hypothetical protein